MTAAKKKINATLIQLALKAIRFALISAYFYWWSYKTERRHKAKVASLGILSVSTLLLLGEALVEAAGTDRIARTWESAVQRFGALDVVAPSVTGLRPWVPWFQGVILALVIMAIVFLIIHHMQEMKKPGYEYLFITRLSDVLLSDSPKDKRVSEAIEIFYSAFRRAGVKHVSIYTKDATVENQLCILDGHVYPKPADMASYAVPLKGGTGVAGCVLAGEKGVDEPLQHLPRYVPRLSWFFGRVPFPHAVKFEFVVDPDAAGSNLKHLELGNEDIETDIVFTPPGSPEPSFASFLSVPVFSRDLHCVGVLNFDFDRFDPLEKGDIAMAVVFGLVLGRELG